MNSEPEVEDVMERRIESLEAEVSDLKVSNGKLSTSVDQLARSVDSLVLVVGVLRDTINRGQGAAKLGMAVAAAAGGIVTLFIQFFLNKS